MFKSKAVIIHTINCWWNLYFLHFILYFFLFLSISFIFSCPHTTPGSKLQHYESRIQSCESKKFPSGAATFFLECILQQRLQSRASTWDLDWEAWQPSQPACSNRRKPWCDEMGPPCFCKLLSSALPPPLVKEVPSIVAPEDEDTAKRPEIGTEAVACVVFPHFRSHVGGSPCHLWSVDRGGRCLLFLNDAMF